MNKLLKILRYAAAVGGCIYIGGAIGYFFGFFDGLAQGGIQASTIVVTLRDLRTGRIQESIKHMEGNLYGNVSNFVMTHDRFRPFDVLNLGGEKAVAPWIVLVRDYRKQFPESLPEPTDRTLDKRGQEQIALIDRTLAKYGQIMDEMRRKSQESRQ